MFRRFLQKGLSLACNSKGGAAGLAPNEGPTCMRTVDLPCAVDETLSGRACWARTPKHELIRQYVRMGRDALVR